MRTDTRLETLELDGTPVTVVREPSGDGLTDQGCVLCYHGFTSSTSAWLNDTHTFARQGFTVVGVDAIGHGRRRYPDFERRFADPRTYGRRFVDIVRETSEELPALVDALTARGLIVDGRLGVFGVSMGGFIAYAAIRKEPRIVAAVSMVSSPEWWMHPSRESPHRYPEAFDNVHLLSMTAGRDVVVPGTYDWFGRYLT